MIIHGMYLLRRANSGTFPISRPIALEKRKTKRPKMLLTSSAALILENLSAASWDGFLSGCSSSDSCRYALLISMALLPRRKPRSW